MRDGKLEKWIDSKLLSSRNRHGTALKVAIILGGTFAGGMATVWFVWCA